MADLALVPTKNRGRLSNAEIASRRKQVFDLRREGLSVTEISERLGWPYATVWQNIHSAIRQMDVTATLEAEVAIDLARLEDIIRIHWPQVKARDLDSTYVVLKALERKAKLLGLDSPKKVDVRVLVAQWAEAQGLEPAIVQDIVSGMLLETRDPT